jgi:thiol:disulfide interchange protein DsbG
LVVLLVGLALAGSAAWAASPARTLRLFNRMGVRVIRRFPTGLGIEGYVIGSGMHRAIVYSVGGGRGILTGNLINAHGVNLTSRFLDRYLVQGGVWNRLAHLPWVAEGAAHPRTIVYAMVDPNCVYCHHLWQWVQPLFKDGLQMRYVFVAVLARSSLGKAARILQSRRPEATYNALEAHYAQGGLPPLPPDQIRPRTLAAIRDSTLLFGWLGFQGTPGIIVRSAQGGLHLTGGVPPEGDLPHLLGLAGTP